MSDKEIKLAIVQSLMSLGADPATVVGSAKDIYNWIISSGD